MYEAYIFMIYTGMIISLALIMLGVLIGNIRFKLEEKEHGKEKVLRHRKPAKNKSSVHDSVRAKSKRKKLPDKENSIR